MYQAPQLNDALQGLQSGESPMDFIRRNLTEQQAATAPAPLDAPAPQARPANMPNPLMQKVEPTVPAESKAAESTTAPIVSKDETPVFDFEKKDDAPKLARDGQNTTNDSSADKVQPGVQKDGGAESAETDTDLPTDDTSTGGQHFKKLRLKVKETESTLKTVLAEKEDLKSQVEKYAKGEVIPEVLQQKEARIAELEHYEQLHNLKGSAAYKEKVAKPLEAKQARLKAIADDYGIPENTLIEALNFEKESELNGFLANHFDGVGALEVKQLVTDMKSLHGQAAEMEKTPAQTLARIQQEQAQIEAAQDATRKNQLAASSRSAWIDALTDIRKDGRALELIRKENDNEHNTKFVDPILKQAAAEYGKFITAFAKAGIKELEPEVGRALAEAVLLAHASATALSTRTEAMRQAEEITNNTRYNSLIRPSVGGGTVSSVPAPAKAIEETPEQMARNQMNSILSKNRR